MFFVQRHVWFLSRGILFLDNQGKALPLLTQVCNVLSVCRRTNELKRTPKTFSVLPGTAEKFRGLFIKMHV